MATLKAMEVDNIDFLIERMGQDCSPNQYLRELTQNAMEAIQRAGRTDGHVIWDHYITPDGVRKLCVVDNGDGMTGLEMIHYINKLSSSHAEQGMSGNYGVGAKISAAVNSPAGLVYISRPDHGEDAGTYSIQLMKAEGKYGLVPYGDSDGYEYFAEVDDENVPEHIAKYGSGTMVIILGKTDDADTASGTIDQWVRKYLNTRYFATPKNIQIQCRDARRTREDEDIDPEEERKVNGLRPVRGQKWMLDGVALHRGVVELTTARAHWWIIPTEKHKFHEPLRLPGGPKPITSMQTFHTAFNYKGHVALVHQNELYDVKTHLAGYHRLQTFGVILGMSQVVLYLEPTAGPIVTDTARTRLLINNEEPRWDVWANEFKNAMPREMADFIETFDVGRNSSEDDAAIREKVKEMLPLFNIARYRKAEKGESEVDETSELPIFPGGAGGRVGGAGARGGRAGSRPRPLLGKLRAGGTSALLVSPKDIPDVVFLYGDKSKEIMNEDIAGHYVDQNLVQANGEFRVFQFLIDHYARQYGDSPGVRKKITPLAERWAKIVIIDVVLGLRAMSSPVWTSSKIDSMLRNDEAFTMALVPRILLTLHLKREIHRELGRPETELKEVQP